MTTTSDLVDDVESHESQSISGAASGGVAASRGETRRARVGAGDRPRANRSPAAQRAIDRRRRRTTQRRTPVLVPSPEPRAALRTRVLRGPGVLLRRVPFAVVVVLVLAAGLALTLWLSTTAAQDSYRLTTAREQQQTQTQRRDALKKSFELGNSASELSDRATRLGMIPATDVPRMVVGGDGKVRVVGEVAPATGAPAPSLNGSTRRSATPQPGSATSQNTAQAPASAAAPAPDGTGTPTSNVLPGNALSPNPTNGNSADGSTSRPADRRGATRSPDAPGATTGGADSSVPR